MLSILMLVILNSERLQIDPVSKDIRLKAYETYESVAFAFLIISLIGSSNVRNMPIAAFCLDMTDALTLL